MGQGLCCVARDVSEATKDDPVPVHFRPGREVLLKDTGSHHVVNDASGPQTPHDPEHELEWSIVANSIPQDELQRLIKFHSRVQDCHVHPSCKKEQRHRQAQTLLRFLRARDGNVDKAEIMFRDMLQWRHDFEVERKVHEWREEMECFRTRRARIVKRYSADVELCEDKFGIPLRIIRISVADAGGSAREIGKEPVLLDSLSKLEWIHEQLRKAMFKHRKLIRGQIQIIDVGDYGHLSPQWYQRLFTAARLGPEMYKVFDLNYPETVRKVFIIRLNTLGNMIWQTILPLVPARTKAKLRIFGWKAATWASELRAELHPGQVLPDFLICDTEKAFATAEPRGGIIPEGAAGSDFGRWDDDETSLNEVPSEPASPLQTQRWDCPPEHRVCSVKSFASPKLPMALAVILATAAVVAALPMGNMAAA